MDRESPSADRTPLLSSVMSCRGRQHLVATNAACSAGRTRRRRAAAQVDAATSRRCCRRCDDLEADAHGASSVRSACWRRCRAFAPWRRRASARCRRCRTSSPCVAGTRSSTSAGIGRLGPRPASLASCTSHAPAASTAAGTPRRTSRDDQQAVVAQDHVRLVAERLHEPRSLVEPGRDAFVLVVGHLAPEHGAVEVVVAKPGLLARDGAAGGGVDVHDAMRVVACLVDRAVDHEAGAVDEAPLESGRAATSILTRFAAVTRCSEGER